MAILGCQRPRDEERVPLIGTQELKADDLPVPPEDGPKLGAVANLVPVFMLPSRSSPKAGALHAGATVARSEVPASTLGCQAGWYKLRPVGFVCLEDGATLDLAHPTLEAMALKPDRTAPLPYTYASVVKTTELYALASEGARVRAVRKLPANSRVAVVGSWSTADSEGNALRLAMLPDGTFVAVAALELATVPLPTGVELGREVTLPIGFVVKRGVRRYRKDGDRLVQGDRIEVHTSLELIGRQVTFEGAQYWPTKEGDWVRHQDVTVVQARHIFPDFVDENARWLDISVATNVLLVYQGKTPKFVTLVSVGEGRLGDDTQGEPVTRRGTFELVSAHITQLEEDPSLPAKGYEVHNLPWVLELSSGQSIHAAFWHNRFGVEYGPGNVQAAPEDARRIWALSGLEVPAGWHSAHQASGSGLVRVVVRP